jgi:hypothetical protein
VIINVGHIPGQDALEQVVSATVRAGGFPYVMRDPVSTGNTLVVAATRPFNRLDPALPQTLQPLAARVQARLAPPLRAGAVYTDDKAPVEWLTDLSILRYATGQR